MNNVYDTVIAVLDTKNDEVKVIEGLPDNICPGTVRKIFRRLCVIFAVSKYECSMLMDERIFFYTDFCG